MGDIRILGNLKLNTDGLGNRSDFEVMQPLFDQGSISGPRGKADSVRMTLEGKARATFWGDRLLLA